MTFVKDDQAVFIQDHGDWDPCNGDCTVGEREMGLNSEYSMGQWEFIAPKQGEVHGWKSTRRKHQG